ncbi:MAG: M28 family metallopeptidase [Bacteroidota bacterium]
MRRTLVFLLALAISGSLATAQGSGPSITTGVSVDSAMANLRVIAGEIGPRPMGSPAEHRAMEYALERLKEFGCDDTFLLPMEVANGVNTNSGVAVGVLKGTSGRIIVIGGHIDSAGPDVPGADDDGSGAACVLEVARVLAQTRHYSTLLFCLWGGEEQGLRGSQYFVSHYGGIDSVALMLQLDMVDGAGPLDIDPDASYQVSSPRWLVDAAYQEFFGVLHHTGLRYPTQFATLNASGSGTTGSDHIPFIERGIPALDFTSDVEFPIHTPLDNLSNFTPSGFKRAGDVVVRLVERFDRGQPPAKTEKYWLVQVGTVPLFIPHWAIRVFTILSLVFAVWLAFRLFRQERTNPPPQRTRGSGAKVALAALGVNAFVWMAPSLMGLLTGYRFPWAAQFESYLGFSLLFGVFGSWFMIRMLLAMRVSGRSAPMFLRAMIAPWIVAAVATAFDLELAIYPAAILALFSLALWLRRPWVGSLLLILAGIIGYRLIFSEATGLFQRALTATSPDVLSQNVLYHLLFIGISWIITLPLGYAGVALYRAVGRDFLALRKFSATPGLALSFGVVVCAGIYLAFQTPYDAKWEPAILVRQAWNAYDTTGTVRIVSSEPFRAMRVDWNGRDTVIAGGTRADLPGPSIQRSSWLSVSASDSVEGETDSVTTLSRTLVLTTPVRPYQVVVTFESKAPFEISSWRWRNWLSSSTRRDEGTSDRRKVFRWYSFPATPLVIPLEIELHSGQQVRQNVEVTFDTLATPVMLENIRGYCTRRMVISMADSLRMPERTRGLAEAQLHE